MLSIVVPAYNEEQRLPATLVRMRAYFDGRDEPYEVLIVDDGSSDGTLALARKTAEDWPQLHVLALAENTGKGAAVRLGMLTAKGEHLGSPGTVRWQSHRAPCRIRRSTCISPAGAR
jgi:dolichyl-phosphate beta-glucosyltransferase